MLTPIARYRLTRGILTFYWLSLFVITHIPIPQRLMPPVRDKVLHLGAYFILCLLLCIHEAQMRLLTVRHYGLIILTLGLYGFIDEVLQIPVNRDANWLDWTADMGGILLGILVFYLFYKRTATPP